MPQEMFNENLIDVLEKRRPHSNIWLLSHLYDETIITEMLINIHTNGKANEIDFSVNGFIFSDLSGLRDVAATGICYK